MQRTNVIIAIIVVIVAGGSLVAYGYYSTNGSIRVYATTGNPDPIYLTVTSVMIHSASNKASWITVSNASRTILLDDNISFLASAGVPVGNYTLVRMTVSSALFTIGGFNVSVKLPSDMFEMPIIGGGLRISGGRSSDLAVVFGPHIVNTGNGNYILSPVVIAEPINSTV